jgi:hypothetical protein
VGCAIVALPVALKAPLALYRAVAAPLPENSAPEALTGALLVPLAVLVGAA